jgi:hypothetical protein
VVRRLLFVLILGLRRILISERQIWLALWGGPLFAVSRGSCRTERRVEPLGREIERDGRHHRIVIIVAHVALRSIPEALMPVPSATVSDNLRRRVGPDAPYRVAGTGWRSWRRSLLEMGAVNDRNFERRCVPIEVSLTGTICRRVKKRNVGVENRRRGRRL